MYKSQPKDAENVCGRGGGGGGARPNSPKEEVDSANYTAILQTLLIFHFIRMQVTSTYAALAGSLCNSSTAAFKVFRVSMQ